MQGNIALINRKALITAGAYSADIPLQTLYDPLDFFWDYLSESV